MVGSKSHLGAQSELIAAVWLMQQGFEVFQNMAATGPADLVAWKPGSSKTYLIDVKTVNMLYQRSDGFTSINVPKPHPDGIHYLVVSKGQVLGFWGCNDVIGGGTDYDPFTE